MLGVEKLDINMFLHTSLLYNVSLLHFFNSADFLKCIGLIEFHCKCTAVNMTLPDFAH